MVLDDEQEAIDHIVDYIKLTDDFELRLATSNPWEVLERIKKEAVDILFLDIEMPDMHGMKLIPQLTYIKESYPVAANLQVVICSAHEEFACESYKHKVADYLTKPIPFDRYMEAVREVKQRLLPVSLNRLDSDNDCLLVYTGRGMEVVRLDYKHVIYVEAQGDSALLWVSSTEYFEACESLRSVMLRLPKANFVKVHRSYVISLRHFKTIAGRSGEQGKWISLEGTDMRIPIGGNGQYSVFENWLAENAIRGKKVSKNKHKKK